MSHDGKFKQPWVIWLIGTPFSGSTILGRSIQRIDGAFYAGEVDRLAQFEMHPHLKNHSIDECENCARKGQKCPVWSDDLMQHPEGFREFLYDAISEATGFDIIVDGSKSPYWYLSQSLTEHFIHLKNRLVIIHCVRNPLAYAASWKLKNINHPREAIKDWIDVNVSSIRLINSLQFVVPSFTVSHTRFLSDPNSVIENLRRTIFPDRRLNGDVSDFHDLGGNFAAKYDPKDVSPIPFHNMFKPTIDYIAKHGPLKSDDRWKQVFSKSEIASLLDMHGLRDIIFLLGLNRDFDF